MSEAFKDTNSRTYMVCMPAEVSPILNFVSPMLNVSPIMNFQRVCIYALQDVHSFDPQPPQACGGLRVSRLWFGNCGVCSGW